MRNWQQALDRAKDGLCDPKEVVEALTELIGLRFEVAKIKYVMGEVAGKLINLTKEGNDETKRDGKRGCGCVCEEKHASRGN